MWDLRLRCILVVLAVAALFPSAVLAQGADRDRDLEDLQAKLFFLRRLVAKYPVSGFAETWKHLEEDAKKGRSAHRDDRPFDEVHRDVLFSWAESLMARDRVDEALERFEVVVVEHEYDRAAPTFRRSTAAAAGIHARKAESAGEDGPKLAHLDRARALYRVIGEERLADGFTDQIVDLKSREGLRLYKERNFAEALVRFQEIENEEGSLGSGEAAAALRTIEEKTGFLSVRFIEIRAPGIEVADVGRLVLTPRGSGEQRTVALSDLGAEKRFRWFTGAYDVGLVLPGGDAAVLTEEAVIGRGESEIRFPGRFPDGMVFIPAGGDVARPFFIDRTEVTEEAYRKFDSKYRRPTQVTGDRLPAHGITFEQAGAYAASVGKKLPSPEQWLYAAFQGRKDQKYPWGGSGPAGFCHFGGKPGPVGVNEYENGTSPFGVLNMAGNVWEWLDNGYAIGGGFRSRALSSKVPGAGWTANFLRDGKPGEDVYLNPKFREQRRYSKYRVVEETLLEVGFRCVIEL